MVLYVIPSFMVGGIAAAFGLRFSDWQFWALVLPVAIASGLLWASHSF